MSDIPGVYVFEKQNAIVSINGECCDQPGQQQFIRTISEPISHKGRKYIPKITGLSPNDLVKQIYRDKDAPGFLRYGRQRILGSGACPIQRYITEDGEKGFKHIQLKEWDDFLKKHPLNKIRLQNYLRRRIANFVMFRNMAMEIRWDNAGNVHSIRNVDFNFLHSGEMNDDGEVEWYLIGDMRNPNKCEWVMAFDPEKKQEMKNAGKAIYFNRDHIPGNNYYAHPDYIGALRELKIRALICDYFISGLKNGWSPKFHIELPAAYVDHIWEAKKKLTGNENITRREILENLAEDFKNKFEGTGNNQSTIITETFIDDEGTEHKIKVNVLDQKSAGDQYMKLAEFTQKSISVAMDVPQVLTGFNNENNMSSGSEVKGHLNFGQTFKSYDDRLMVLEGHYILAYCLEVKEDFDFVFEGFLFVNDDKEKSGMLPTIDNE